MQCFMLDLSITPATNQILTAAAESCKGNTNTNHLISNEKDDDNNNNSNSEESLLTDGKSRADVGALSKISSLQSSFDFGSSEIDALENEVKQQVCY
jgi:hypothetical protein